MNHALILMAVHSDPVVLKYMLGTWLECYDQSYRVTICMAVREDYDACGGNFKEVEALCPPLKIVRTPKSDDHNDIMSVSRDISFRLETMLRDHASCDHTHVAFLHCDLEFRSDFIKWAMGQNADMVGALCGSNTVDAPYHANRWGYGLYLTPHPTDCHLVMGRAFADRIVNCPGILAPANEWCLIYDLGDVLYERARCEWGSDIRIFPLLEIEKMVRHFKAVSFGPSRNSNRNAHLQEIKGLYAKRFPNGIEQLLGKLR